MRVQILAAGARQPAWVQSAFGEYAKRMPPEYHFGITEIRLAARHKPEEAARARADEGVRMLAAIPPAARVIALDVRGKSFDTGTLARQLRNWLQDGRDLTLLIGGPDGLAAACLERAEFSWSLSALTFPHGLVRVIVAEQLYRAWTILQGHPYHRG